MADALYARQDVFGELLRAGVTTLALTPDEIPDEKSDNVISHPVGILSIFLSHKAPNPEPSSRIRHVGGRFN